MFFVFLPVLIEILGQCCNKSIFFPARCIHYFDTVKFFAEVDRLLHPGGVLVYYT